MRARTPGNERPSLRCVLCGHAIFGTPRMTAGRHPIGPKCAARAGLIERSKRRAAVRAARASAREHREAGQIDWVDEVAA